MQVGSFASEPNAQGLAAKVGGQVQRSGNLWRVRMGPFNNLAAANAALARARSAGYNDARVQRTD